MSSRRMDFDSVRFERMTKKAQEAGANTDKIEEKNETGLKVSGKKEKQIPKVKKKKTTEVNFQFVSKQAKGFRAQDSQSHIRIFVFVA